MSEISQTTEPRRWTLTAHQLVTENNVDGTLLGLDESVEVIELTPDVQYVLRTSPESRMLDASERIAELEAKKHK